MKHNLLLPLTLFFLAAQSCAAQGNTTDALTGTWKGTSLCQIKNSPCHDETAVYHISQSGKKNVYTFQMNKMVNGVEEEMGATDFVLDEKGKTLVGKTTDRQQRVAIWTFVIKGTHISGTLMQGGTTLYRKIEIDKQ